MKRVLAVSVFLLAQAAVAQESLPFEDQVAEYIRLFPYQVTHDYTMRFTGGDPRNLNSWLPKGEPALVRPGDDIVPRTNRDTFYKGAALSFTNSPVILESTAPSRERFNSFQLVDDRNAVTRIRTPHAARFDRPLFAVADHVIQFSLSEHLIGRDIEGDLAPFRDGIAEWLACTHDRA